MTAIDQRRSYTVGRLDELKARLVNSDRIVRETACVCVTGSYGRLEASSHSDLDLFIVGANKTNTEVGPSATIHDSKLSHLDEICVKADLISISRSVGIPEFDADGRYLAHFSISRLVGMLGRPEDDADNTFTSRLLLLLEGRALVGEGVFYTAVDDIIASYWRDYEDHGDAFAPAFLSNDILRLWRTFCVNYEARTTNTPHDKKLKRRVKNYKLKFSRLLTCYSALMHMLYIFRRNATVRPSDMRDICTLTPLQRIEALRSEVNLRGAVGDLDEIVTLYDHFLAVTDKPEPELFQDFDDKNKRSDMLSSSYAFADAIFRSIGIIGDGCKLHRMLLV